MLGISLILILMHLPHQYHDDQPTHGGAGGWVGGMAVICGGEPQPFAMTNECFGYSVQVYVDDGDDDDYLWRGT